VFRFLSRWLRPRTDKQLGRAGERLAARHLRRAGYSILGRNIRVQVGEADLVCLAPDRSTLVIVEVKTRRRSAGKAAMSELVPPEASVHQHKRSKLAAVARTLVRANKWQDRTIRIDIIAIEWPDDGSTPTIRHHQGAAT
jgi:putative endonuclease